MNWMWADSCSDAVLPLTMPHADWGYQSSCLWNLNLKHISRDIHAAEQPSERSLYEGQFSFLSTGVRHSAELLLWLTAHNNHCSSSVLQNLFTSWLLCMWGLCATNVVRNSKQCNRTEHFLWLNEVIGKRFLCLPSVLSSCSFSEFPHIRLHQLAETRRWLGN